MEPNEPKKNNITINDIAEKLGISASTVSRALNDHPKINIKTKESIWALAKQMGYYPNVPVYMNKTSHTSVAIIVPEFNFFYNDLIKGAQNYFNKKTIILYVLCSQYDNEREKNLLTECRNIGMKGIILSVFENNIEINRLIEENLEEIPIVLINKFEDNLQVSKIIPDIHNGAYKAVNHLYSTGCRKIGLFSGSSINTLFAELRFGYESALKSLDIECNDNYLYFSNFGQNDIAHGIEKLINRVDRPDGLLVADQYVAQQIVAYLRNAGLNVPQDIAIISFGDEPFGSFVSPSLSTISISGENIGRLAAKEIYKTMFDKTKATATVIEQAKVIIRGSSMRMNVAKV